MNDTFRIKITYFGRPFSTNNPRAGVFQQRRHGVPPYEGETCYGQFPRAKALSSIHISQKLKKNLRQLKFLLATASELRYSWALTDGNSSTAASTGTAIG
jgi:hypothetical protein